MTAASAEERWISSCVVQMSLKLAAAHAAVVLGQPLEKSTIWSWN